MPASHKNKFLRVPLGPQDEYMPVNSKDNLESSDSDSAYDDETLLTKKQLQRQQSQWLLRVLIVACIILACLLVWMIIFIQRHPRIILSDHQCAIQLSTEGPALDAVEYEVITFRGAQDDDNPYKGHPRPELDKAWTELTEVRHVSVAPSTIEAINKTKLEAIQLVDGNYLGATEVFHQLHCLNLIRQHSYKEWYDVDGRRPPGLTDSATTLRHHVDHCIDILRQNIMCVGDTTVITHNWVKGYQFPYPNFNTQHKCRKFNKIVEWEKMHQVQDPDMPAGAVVLPSPPTA